MEKRLDEVRQEAVKGVAFSKKKGPFVQDPFVCAFAVPDSKDHQTMGACLVACKTIIVVHVDGFTKKKMAVVTLMHAQLPFDAKLYSMLLYGAHPWTGDGKQWLP